MSVDLSYLEYDEEKWKEYVNKMSKRELKILCWDLRDSMRGILKEAYNGMKKIHKGNYYRKQVIINYCLDVKKL